MNAQANNKETVFLVTGAVFVVSFLVGLVTFFLALKGSEVAAVVFLWCVIYCIGGYLVLFVDPYGGQDYVENIKRDDEWEVDWTCGMALTKLNARNVAFYHLFQSSDPFDK